MSFQDPWRDPQRFDDPRSHDQQWFRDLSGPRAAGGSGSGPLPTGEARFRQPDGAARFGPGGAAWSGQSGTGPGQPFDGPGGYPFDRPRRPERRIGGLRPRTLALISMLLGSLLVALGLVAWQPVMRQVPPPDPVTVVPGQRVLPEVVAPDAPGGYAFLYTNADGTPVRYDPCQTIDYWINPARMPRGGESAIHAAARTVGAHSGLALQYRGTTELTVDEWPADKTGQPVLFMWATEAEDPELAGSTLGYAGSSAWGTDGDRRYVRGRVVLDAEDLDVMPLRRQHAIESVATHELAHVVGLGHVEAGRQLMAPAYDRPPGLGAGDRAGLARIGAGSCH